MAALNHTEPDRIPLFRPNDIKTREPYDAGLQAFLDGDWDSPTWLESMKHVEQLLPFLDENDLEHDAGTIPLSVSEGTMLFDINGPWIMGNLNMDIEAVPDAIGGAPMPTPGGVLMVGGSGYAIGTTAMNTGHPDHGCQITHGRAHGVDHRGELWPCALDLHGSHVHRR